MHWMQLMEHTPFTEEAVCSSQLAVHSDGPNSQIQMTKLRTQKTLCQFERAELLGWTPLPWALLHHCAVPKVALNEANF